MLYSGTNRLDALIIDDEASPERLGLAADLLTDGRSVVILAGLVALRGTSGEILCEVVDPSPAARRCNEEYRALVENAARGLEQSCLYQYLPRKPLRWLVVDDYGTGAVQLWPLP